MAQNRLTGKTALITGAGQGVGKELSLLFANEGAHVFICDISVSNLKEVEKIIVEKGLSATAVKADISQLEDIRHFANRALSDTGKIDILINNASVSFTKDMMAINEEDWNTVFDINVKGTFFLLQYVAGKMIEKGIGGSIVNIASIAGMSGRPLFIPYSASKAAVINITKSTALELAQHNIRVNAIAPGTIDTPMWKNIAKNIADIQHGDSDALEKMWVEKIPLKRLATPKDIGQLALHLCSEESSYIIGQTITICGGLSIL